LISVFRNLFPKTGLAVNREGNTGLIPPAFKYYYKCCNKITEEEEFERIEEDRTLARKLTNKNNKKVSV